MKWLAKVRRYGPGGTYVGESVISTHESKTTAQQVVADWNNQYHTDAAYAEEFKAEKLYFPMVSDEEMKEILDSLSDY